MATSGEFPEHECVWEILLVGNNPVGVFCKVCEKTFHMSESAPTPPVPFSRPPRLPLMVHSIVEVELVKGQVQHAVVQRCQVDMGRGQNPQLVVEFELPGQLNYIPQPMQRMNTRTNLSSDHTHIRFTK